MESGKFIFKGKLESLYYKLQNTPELQEKVKEIKERHAKRYKDRGIFLVDLKNKTIEIVKWL